MTPIDDPAKAEAGPETDARMAEEWMGWRQHFGLWFDADGPTGYGCTEAAMVRWSPSTNPAHAGEARRTADNWDMDTFCGGTSENLVQGVRASIDIDGKWYYGKAYASEVTAGGRKEEIIALVESLAICRACLAAMKAKADDSEVDEDPEGEG